MRLGETLESRHSTKRNVKQRSWVSLASPRANFDGLHKKNPSPLNRWRAFRAIRAVTKFDDIWRLFTLLPVFVIIFGDAMRQKKTQKHPANDSGSWVGFLMPTVPRPFDVVNVVQRKRNTHTHTERGNWCYGSKTWRQLPRFRAGWIGKATIN